MTSVTYIVCTMNNLQELTKTVRSLKQIIAEYDELVVISSSKASDYENEVRCLDDLSLRCCLITRWMPPSGVYAAINTGVRLAGGDWVNIIHAGDIVILGSFCDIRRAFEDSRLEFVICNQRYGPNMNHSSILDAKHHPEVIPHQSTFYRRRLHLEHGYYDETKRSISDQLFLMPLVSRSNTFYSPLIYCFYNTNGMSSNFDYEIFKEEMLTKRGFYSKFGHVIKGALKFLLTIFGSRIMQAMRSIKNKLVVILR